MQITAAQKKVLDEFVCERLTANPDNKHLIKNFKNSRNINLQNQLLDSGWEEDLSGSNAYYIIKKNDKIALYFTLKTGLMYHKIASPETLNEIVEKRKKSLIKVLNIKNWIKKISKNSTEEEALLKKAGIEEDTVQKLKRNLKISKVKKQNFNDDKIKESNKELNYVHYTFPGIELHIFCANENFKDEWKMLGFPKENNKMGIILFWKFIVPKIFEIQKHIGCVFFYLFAADNSTDGSLIGYYNLLKFKQDNTFSTDKPSFDWSCFFMFQEIKQLQIERDNFFNNFNTDPDDFI